MGFVALLAAIVGVAFWFATANSKPPRISRSFSSEGIKKVILRAAQAATSEVVSDPAATEIMVMGVSVGGAQGYHSPDFFWRETPASEWGLDFVSARHGDVLVISTKNEIHYIHHLYLLQSVVLTVPAGVEVVRQAKKLTGDGAPDLEVP